MSRPLALQLTEAAEADLVDIWMGLAVEASEDVASRFVLGLQQRFGPLQYHPELGVGRPKLGLGLRVIFQAPYAIYYKADDEAVVIIRVLHGARDVSALAEHGGLS